MRVKCDDWCLTALSTQAGYTAPTALIKTVKTHLTGPKGIKGTGFYRPQEDMERGCAKRLPST